MVVLPMAHRRGSGGVHNLRKLFAQHTQTFLKRGSSTFTCGSRPIAPGTRPGFPGGA